MLQLCGIANNFNFIRPFLHRLKRIVTVLHMVAPRKTAKGVKHGVKHWLNILVFPAPDLPGQWISHCLELDLVSQGNNPHQALEMMVDAIELCAQANVKAGRPPLTLRNAPNEIWDLFRGAEDICTRILRIEGDRPSDEITLEARSPEARAG